MRRGAAPLTTVYFEYHAQTLDNEAGIASGHYDVELSEAGRTQAAGEKAERCRGMHLDAVLTSDTRRAYQTARIMVEGRDIPIVQDARLRECDYGDLTRHPHAEVSSRKAECITTPFPNGESDKDVAERMESFLDDLVERYPDETVLIIGHGATRIGLEHAINGVPIAETLATEWPLTAKYELGQPSRPPSPTRR